MVTMVPARFQGPLGAPVQSWTGVSQCLPIHSGKERGLGVAGHGGNRSEVGPGAVITKMSHNMGDRNGRIESEERDMTRGQGR